MAAARLAVTIPRPLTLGIMLRRPVRAALCRSTRTERRAVIPSAVRDIRRGAARLARVAVRRATRTVPLCVIMRWPVRRTLRRPAVAGWRIFTSAAVRSNIRGRTERFSRVAIRHAAPAALR
jgi:hypothetical protein